MSKQLKFDTFRASVVLVSPSAIDPKSIDPGTLKRAEIVKWESIENISTPVFAETRYQNGIRIRTEGNRCVFEEPTSGESSGDFKVHRLAERYLQATKLVTYNAIGINWANKINVNDPVQWFAKNVANNVKLPDFSPISMQLTEVLDPTVSCILTFLIKDDSLIADFNFHCNLTNAPETGITSYLRRWPEWQNHMQSTASILEE